MKWILIALLVPLVAHGQVQRKPVIEPAVSAVLSGPSGPLYQVGGGLRYAGWSYEVRYGWDMAVTENTERAFGFQSLGLYARNDVSNVFYWTLGYIHVHHWGIDGMSPRSFDWIIDSPALGLGVGYKYIFLELQAYYPGALIGIRVGVN